ncbi:MAG TPA: type VI secretion system-associated FHA domain protein TagH [Rhodobacteraceae bacterium]|nr:type VI secretion system-associated FHA domain protein TagH [Paracoccaceae bacterium]
MGLTLHMQGSGMMPNGMTSVQLVNGAVSLGRADGNDVVLPDPDRTISSRHCIIEERGNDYVVMDISTNGTFLNYMPQPLGPTPSPLNHGDTIAIGGFEFRVEINVGLGAPALDPYANLAAPMMDDLLAPLPPEGEEPAGFVGGLDDAGAATGDAIAALLGDGPAVGPDATGLSAPPPEPAPLIPEDEDIFGPGGDPFDGVETSAPDHGASAQDYFAAPPSQAGAGALIPDDWDLSESVAVAAPSPQPAPAPQAAVAPVTSAPVSGDAARAFLGAAKAGEDLDDAELVAAMERTGAAYRVMVEGLRDVLMTRASIKSEFRLGQTMISPDGNNPIKFSVSADQAVEAMVKPNMPGYLEAEKAAKEAVNDIKAHEVAMMTGMQAAIKKLLERFDPATLSAKIEAKKGLFGGGKAKRWDVFEKMYGEIASEAEDDFQALFGAAFAKAYEEQLRKLR